jgi:branched-chain amino acid transport system permease protein
MSELLAPTAIPAPQVPAVQKGFEVLTRRRSGPVLIVALVAVAYGLSFVLNAYWLDAILIPFLIMALAGLGLNLLTGYTGQASLGTGAFMAVGAYATFNLFVRVPELPQLASLVLGGLFAAGAGVIFGLPSLRIKGFYLTASTLAAQFFVPWLFNQYAWFSNNNGSNVISAPRLILLGYDLTSPAGRYVVTLTTVVALTWLSWNLVTSQVGRNWMAIREMDTAAAVAGIPVSFNKLAAFAVSSFVIGIAGALWAFAYLQTVDSRSFGLDRSFTVLFIIIIGGMGSIAGAFIGSAFVILLPIFFDFAGSSWFGDRIDSGQLQNLEKILFGGLIMFFLIKEPNGLIALFTRFRRRLSQWPLKP